MIKLKFSDKQLLLFVAISLAIILWVSNGILLTPISVLDDAFITLSNAEILVGIRKTSVFVEQGIFTGSTSFLHTCMIAFMLLSGLEGEVVLALSSLLGCLFYLTGAVLLIDLFAIKRRYKFYCLLISFFMGVIPNQLTNGLETGLAMACVIWAIYLYLKDGQAKKWGLPILLGLMPLVRPELIALAGLIFLACLYEDYKAGKSITEIIKTALRIMLLGLLVSLPFLFVFYLDSGSLFLNTVWAKKYFFAEGCLGFIEKWRLFFWALVVFIGPLFLSVLFVPYLRKHILGLALLLFAIVLLSTYWMNAPGSLAHYSGRYCYLLVPIIFYAVLVYVNQFQFNSRKMLLFYGLLAQTLVLNVFFNGYMFQQRITFMKNNQRANASWLKENTQPGDVLLVHDVGYLGYVLSDRTVIDMVGLKTPDVVRFHQDITWASCGKNRGLAIAEIAKKYQADYVVVFSWWDDDFMLTSRLSDMASIELVKGYNVLTNGGYNIYKLSY